MTYLSGLKPGAVFGAAVADTKRYEHNQNASGTYEQYAFHRTHVRMAMERGYGRGFDVIAEALKDQRRGLNSGKRLTRILYAEKELLQAALTIGEQRTTDESPQSRPA